jgi:hypothetical protein
MYRAYIKCLDASELKLFKINHKVHFWSASY